MYMSTLVEKQIQVNRILTMNPNQARAIEEPVRARIIKILYNTRTMFSNNRLIS